MRFSAVLPICMVLASLGGCLGDKPDQLHPSRPTLSSPPHITSTVSPAAPPHDIGLVQLQAGESAAYVQLSTKGHDESIHGRFRATTLNGGGGAFHFVAINDIGEIVWADEAPQHEFFHGVDQGNLTLRFYAKSAAKVYVTINGTYIAGQGDILVERDTATFDAVPLAATEFTIRVEGAVVAAELANGTGEYVLKDPGGTERATWPSSPYTLTALRGDWRLRAGPASLGTVDVTLVRLPSP